MARGGILLSTLSPHSTTTTTLLQSKFPTLPFTRLQNVAVSFFCRPTRPPTRFFCQCSKQLRVSPEYSQAFSKRMALAGLGPHHRIAMGVSGGADSMALCVLMSQWKKQANPVCSDSSGLIDGLLAVIVDHGLRPESGEEAETVSRWVSDMGIRSEVVQCDWPNGLPKVGHLEETARDMRYRIFQDVCCRNQIKVMLIAHHADDQAELFILRLSRNSGVLGLAGMAFTCQLFPEFPQNYNNQGILLVRPLLGFNKEDLYKICERSGQKWVEDPSNRSSLFVRNRIRHELQDMKNSVFRSELQELIAICRRTRLYVDHICHSMLDQAVSIVPHGYAVIDLENLSPFIRGDMSLSRFLALVVQFISQRQRPVRGSALKLLLNYIRTSPCKTSLTAAGCYLCPAPGSKGTKVLVCCSVDSVLPVKTELYSCYSSADMRQYVPFDIGHRSEEKESQSQHIFSEMSDVHFLDTKSADSVLDEARRLSILSEPTLQTIIELQNKENKLFRSKAEVVSNNEVANAIAKPISEPFQPGMSCSFMNRFFLTWIGIEQRNSSNFSEDGDGTLPHTCGLCVAGDEVAYVRHMIEEDWLYLAKLLNDPNAMASNTRMDQVTHGTVVCAHHTRLSTQQALTILKSVPVAARRGLPVVVSKDGVLLSIPSIGFKHCPCLEISAQFRPRVPLGGGHSSFI